MKQKDIALIVVVAVFAGIFALVLAHFLFATPKDRQQKVEVVDPISTQFQLPDSKYYNSTSINPTELIRIAENSNSAPIHDTNQ